MSQENVEKVRRAYDVFNQGDPSAMLEFLHPDFEFRSLGLDEPIYRGHDGFLEYTANVADAWESMRLEVEQIIDLDDERLVVALRFAAMGKGGGVPIEQHIAVVWTMSDGKAMRGMTYPELSAALEALGLRE